MGEPEMQPHFKESTLVRIQKLIASGIKSRKEIITQTRLSARYVWRLIRENNLLPSRRDQTIEKLRELYNRGLTLQQAAKEMDTAPANVRSHVRVYDLDMQFSSPQLPATDENAQTALANTNPEERELVKKILQGYSIYQIGKRFDFTYEWARQYIKDHQLYLLWQKARTRAKQRTSEKQHSEEKECTHARENFLSLLEARVQQHCSLELSWPEKKCVEHIYKRKRIQRNNIPSQKILKVYQSYEKAKNEGKKISFESIGKEAGVSSLVAWRLIKKAGCKSLHWTYVRRHGISQEEKAQIREASLLQMPLQDLQYFSGFSSTCFIKYGIKREHDTAIRKRFGSDGPRLTYRLASQMYEAQDLDFTLQQIQKLFSIAEAYVNYAFFHKREIQELIIRALQIFHPEGKITKPYLSKGS
jgi:DNA-binding CsgD family transcriptional regulator